MPQPGLCVDTVQEAREEISRRLAGMGGAVCLSAEHC